MKKWWLRICIGSLGLMLGDPVVSAKDEDANTVYVIPVEGVIEPALVYIIRRGVTEAEDTKAAAIIFRFNTPGGRLNEAKEIVNLIKNISIPTYSFVAEEAISAGAIISLATKSIYMAPGSTIGDAMPIMMSPFSGPQPLPEDHQEKIVSYTAALIRSAAEQGGHDTELAEAMVRRENEYKIDEEIICPEGELLTLTNEEAAQLVGEDQVPLLSSGTVDDIASLLVEIGLEDATLYEVEIAGAEKVARFIQMLAPFLLGAGLLGLYIEFKSPGFGIPGILGLVCLGIMYWGHHVAGLAGAEELLIVLLGLVLIAVEVFIIPGFGVAGIGGLFLVILGLLLVMVQHYPGGPSIPSWPQFQLPIRNLAIALLTTVAAGSALTRYLPQTRFFGMLTLSKTISREQGFVSSNDTRNLIGKHGTAVTHLRPSGSIMIDDRRIDVVTLGDFIERGSNVRIVEAHGNRVVVEPESTAT